VLIIYDVYSSMCSGWEFERDYEPTCVDDGFCGNYWHAAELGYELLLLLRFVRFVSADRMGIEKVSWGNWRVAFLGGVSVEYSWCSGSRVTRVSLVLCV
jgi:hypothetical protein